MVDPRLLTYLEPPVIEGSGNVGTVLRCSPGEWRDADKLTFQWLKFGKPITAARHDRYFVLETDRARPISAVVIAQNQSGRISSPRSNTITARAALPPPRRDAAPPVVQPRAPPPPETADLRPIKTVVAEVVLATPPPGQPLARPPV
jgi:hypothetical protein